MANDDIKYRVGMEPDLPSAEATGEKLAESVQKGIAKKTGSKNGYIELNLDIANKPIKGLDKQKEEILNMWKEVSKKGGLLSAPKKDINEFLDKYNKFSKLIGQSHKGKSSAYKEIERVIGEQVDSYKKIYSEENLKRVQEKLLRESKARSVAKKETRINKKEDAKIIKDLSKGTSAHKASAPGSDINLGLAKQTSADKSPYTSKHSVMQSETSAYTNPWKIAEEVHRKEEDAKTKAKTHKWIDKNYKYNPDEKVAEGHIKVEQGNKHSKTELDVNAKIEAANALNDLAKVFKQLEKNLESITDSDLYQKLNTARNTLKALGNDEETTQNKIIDKIEKAYDQSMTKQLGGTNGGQKGVGPGHKLALAAKKRMFEIFDQLAKNIEPGQMMAKRFARDMANPTQGKRGSQWDAQREKYEKESIDPELKQAIAESNRKADKTNDAIENQTAYDKIENSAERIADSSEAKKNQEIIKDIEEDASTGLNTDSKSNELIDAIKGGPAKEASAGNLSASMKTNLEGIMCPCQEILSAILAEIRGIVKNGVKTTRKAGKNSDDNEKEETSLATTTTRALQSVQENIEKALVPITGTQKTFYEGKDLFQEQKAQRILEEDSQRKSKMGPLQRSMIETSIVNPFKKIQSNYEKIMAATSKEQDALAAQRIREYGIGMGGKATDTSDKIRFARRMSFWRSNDQFGEMFKNFKLTPGVKVDTTEITSAIAKVLSGPQMFKAQSGGWLNNLAIAGTGGLAAVFQPSLEKSRAQADAVNSIMADIREAMNTVLQDILAKESVLGDMQEKGDIAFNTDGSILRGTSEATVTALQLEESKLALASILADAGMIDEVVARTGGRLTEIVQQLGFTSPMLRKNNAILANINAGLDKNGKALKFQTRSQEILNYSFQLMSRHLGQMIKRWMLMLNPINLIKKAFNDFASYDVKWQRTMNVIKYNLRRIVKPMMEWIAQQLVNMIGLVNALMKGIGKVFNQNWDLFDQSAANAEKMHEELEAAANVTAGFDELHDIGGDSSNPAMDLMGDIYTPQWDGLNKVLEDIGETIGNIIATVSGWNFWTWLAIAGAALGGYLILKWLINAFKGGINPLQTVAKGFQFLEKAVGWAILIASFALFTKVLTEFIECMKTAEWEDIGKSLAMLGGALLELGITMIALMGLAKLFGTTFLQSFGVAAIVAAFALLITSLAYFIDTVSKVRNAGEILQGLAGILLVVAGVIVVLLAVLTALISTGLGALAVLALAAILAAIALVIVAMADFVRAVGENAEAVKMFMEELRETMRTWGEVIVSIITAIGNAISGIIETIATGIETIGNVIIGIVEAVANGITTILQPILDFIDGVIGKIIELATTVAHEIGETIRTIIKTTGDVIIGIIDAIVNAIPRLLDSILNFCREIGPAIENSVDAILRSITKLINFIVSGIEYLVNTLLIGSINKAISTVTFGMVSNLISEVSIPRFVPQYEQGTNYVPNNGLAYLHQGEAVIPKKYNQPYNNGMSNEERAYMQQMMTTMRSLDSTMQRGIPISGEFRQRGSDLVAIVNKTKSQAGSDLLSNVAYAR